MVHKLGNYISLINKQTKLSGEVLKNCSTDSFLNLCNYHWLFFCRAVLSLPHLPWRSQPNLLPIYLKLPLWLMRLASKFIYDWIWILYMLTRVQTPLSSLRLIDINTVCTYSIWDRLESKIDQVYWYCINCIIKQEYKAKQKQSQKTINIGE